MFVSLGLRSPGDGSHPAAAERRLMLTPMSGYLRQDRRFIMTLNETFGDFDVTFSWVVYIFCRHRHYHS